MTDWLGQTSCFCTLHFFNCISLNLYYAICTAYWLIVLSMHGRVCGWQVVWLCCCWTQLGSTGRCFRFTFSYSDRVPHVTDQISSFSNFSISRKFVSVSDLSEFDFVFIFKCESENNIGVIPTAFDHFQPYRSLLPEDIKGRLSHIKSKKM
jgi:hypothetical protein